MGKLHLSGEGASQDQETPQPQAAGNSGGSGRAAPGPLPLGPLQPRARRPRCRVACEASWPTEPRCPVRAALGSEEAPGTASLPGIWKLPVQDRPLSRATGRKPCCPAHSRTRSIPREQPARAPVRSQVPGHTPAHVPWLDALALGTRMGPLGHKTGVRLSVTGKVPQWFPRSTLYHHSQAPTCPCPHQYQVLATSFKCYFIY